MKPTGFLREECRGFGLPENGKAARFVEVGRNLGEEFVGGEADGYRDTEFPFNLGGKTRQHFRRAHAVQSLGTGQVKKRLVDR